MILRAIRRLWSEVLIARGELATIFVTVRGITENLSELNRTTQALVRQTKLPCFVMGTAVIDTSRKEPTVVSSDIVWLAPGDKGMLRLQFQANLKDLVVRIEAPFVFTEVKMGNTSKMWTTHPTFVREVPIGDVNIGIQILCQVEYPADLPVGRDGFR